MKKQRPKPAETYINLAAVTVGSDGRTYGTWPVFLTRGTEVILGRRMGRYGGVMVEQYRGQFYVEQPERIWENWGWTITDPPIPEQVDPALQAYRETLRADEQ